MRLPLAWLHDYCRPELDSAGLAERLDLTGTKVERRFAHGVGELEAFVVGRVLSAERHPQADRLTVCMVDVGDGDARQIVCGAPNVAAEQTVAVARPGARMPDGATLGTARLRGVESDGMILAEDELGIGPDHAGILVLDGEHKPGTPLADVLPIATEVLELEITPNRPDCLAVYGVAREVHAVTGASLEPPPWADDPGSEGGLEGAAVTVEDPDLCPRFTARVFEGVVVGPSPPWLKARLTAAGQRPISNVVDITNYVMLLTGQPLHAFDLDEVPGGHLIVRTAREGEGLATLDGVQRELDAQMVVVCDDNGPSGIAGVMGGAHSEVSEGTTRVLMEAATWNGPNIQRTSTRLGLRTEASARFEKQLQPEQAMEAQAVAARLMADLCGATIRPGTVDVGGPGPAPAVIRLRDERVARLLGRGVPAERSAEILTALGFGVTTAEDGLDVEVPPFRRGDVTREADLIEEVARVDGLERLPSTLPSRRGAVGGLSAEQALRRRAEDSLVGRGLSEAVGWSFTDPAMSDRLRLPPEDERRRVVALANPMSEEQSVMRTTLLGSLLDVARHNAARGTRDIAVWETGGVYLDAGEGELPDERRHLAALLVGSARPATWRDPEPPRADLFAAKAALAGVLDTLRAPWSVRAAPQPFLHPGRAAEVLVGEVSAGWLGEIHPLVAETWEVAPGAAWEIDFDAAVSAAERVPLHEDLTSFPSIHQDLALVVSDDVPAAQVIDAVREAGGPLLARVDVFDVYRGPQAGEGRVSLALALEFRAPDRTLTDAEAAQARTEIETAVKRDLGATLRA